MTETVVSYHADGPYDEARPAINVKVRTAGSGFWPDSFDAIVAATPDGQFPRVGTLFLYGILATAYDMVTEAFWHDAEIMAKESGLGPVTAEGRSGGWLVFTDGRDPRLPSYFGNIAVEQDEAVAEWLAAYRAMSEWCDSFIDDAPRKVRDLAQSIAMDHVGEAAALRMFAFERIV